jgi:hypothetical protein
LTTGLLLRRIYQVSGSIILGFVAWAVLAAVR